MDIDAYFARILYTGPREPTLDTLQRLVLAHATSIPFENLDVLNGRGISLADEDVAGARCLVSVGDSNEASSAGAVNPLPADSDVGGTTRSDASCATPPGGVKVTS